MLTGIISFLALSFVLHFFHVSELLGNFLSRFLTIVYQIVAVVGLGQMYIFNFVYSIDIEIRTVLSYTFLVAAVVNVVIFAAFAAMQSKYLACYFRFTFVHQPLFLLRLMDAMSEVKDLIF